MLLDQCNPTGGQELMIQSRTFRVTAYLHGVALDFMADSPALETWEGHPAYRISLPELVHYPQHRISQRISLPIGTAVRFECNLLGSFGSVRGELADLSERGMAAVIPVTRVAKGQTLTNCRLLFPDGDSVEFSLLIRHIHRASSGSRMRIGGSFADASPSMLRKIERILTSLRREQLRCHKQRYLTISSSTKK
jgi:c-di-GMP-binding flagellar brake protein YcgR